MLWGSLGTTYGKVLESYECMKLGYTDVKVLSTILWKVDGIIINIDVGTELESLDGSLDGLNDGKPGGLLLGDFGIYWW